MGYLVQNSLVSHEGKLVQVEVLPSMSVSVNGEFLPFYNREESLCLAGILRASNSFCLVPDIKRQVADLEHEAGPFGAIGLDKHIRYIYEDVIDRLFTKESVLGQFLFKLSDEPYGIALIDNVVDVAYGIDRLDRYFEMYPERSHLAEAVRNRFQEQFARLESTTGTQVVKPVARVGQVMPKEASNAQEVSSKITRPRAEEKVTVDTDGIVNVLPPRSGRLVTPRPTAQSVDKKQAHNPVLVTGDMVRRRTVEEVKIIGVGAEFSVNDFAKKLNLSSASMTMNVQYAINLLIRGGYIELVDSNSGTAANLRYRRTSKSFDESQPDS